MLDNSGGGGAGGDGSGGGTMTVEEMVAAVENGSASGGVGGDEERGKGEGGHRWPREETLALLKIRADMDLTFRDATLKAPLWDEVSRKLGELGYHRSARKCKEKFENIFKYHKRTRECRSGRQNGKSYRFFEQLERFDSQPSFSSPPPNHNQNQIQTHGVEPAIAAAPISFKPTGGSIDVMVPRPIQNASMDFVSPSTSTTSSSERDSEGSSKKKRKLSDYFEKLMREVLEKQETLQIQLLEALEKCEKDRMEREEAWRLQQMDRIKKEQEYLAQERAISAARDATVMAFLRKISEQASVQFPEPPTPVSDKHVDKQQLQTPVPLTRAVGNSELENNNCRQLDVPDREVLKQGNGFSDNINHATTSRWPKTEVEDLIRLRTNLGMQFQDNGLKGPLWEEISSAMKQLGYSRSAKRCKEKWENINKYYKRVKESNKRRPESSKTCPYFNLLESLYERKSQRAEPNQDWSASNLKPEDILMQMMGQQDLLQKQSLTEDDGCNNVNQSREDDAMEEDEDDDRGGGYELVSNHPPVSSVE